jgi:hypothetical protein
MLKQISCDIFLESPIDFHKGLNVILGDNKASNSIGKSSLLMIIDFIFGGNSYIDKNSDVITNIREHQFLFCFEFDNTMYYFKRSTDEYKYVHICDDKYNTIEKVRVEKYTEFLKEKYKIDNDSITFRGIVSLYSRIWQKGNFDVKKPLHELSAKNYKDAIINLIKLFNKYSKIRELENEIKELEDSKKAVQKAEKYHYIPKVNKSTYNKNKKEIDRIKKEIEKVALAISMDYNRFAEKLDTELSDQINALKRQKSNYELQLRRIRRNKIRDKITNAKQFETLLEFFPDVNMNKINEIEKFHMSLVNVLKDEIEKSESEIISKLKTIDSNITKLELDFSKKVEQVPDSEFVRPLLELSSQLNQKENENSLYEKKASILEDIKDVKEQLGKVKTTILFELSNLINKEIASINERIHKDGRRPPQIILLENMYHFGVEDNTGTGEAYTSLIEFDLSVLKLTKLPFIIHDSMMFKNIENDVIDEIINIYNEQTKQIFIAIDEKNKFNKRTQNIIEKNKVINLSENKLLFIKDWRKNK